MEGEIHFRNEIFANAFDSCDETMAHPLSQHRATLQAAGPVTILIVGAGNRGKGYARHALDQPGQLRVVGVAEPRAFHRNEVRDSHAVDPDNVFADWREAAARPRFADAVLIATQARIRIVGTILDR